MEVTKDISMRFRFVSGISMLMVVLIHARLIRTPLGENLLDMSTFVGLASYYLQFVLSENICRVAVPLFFLISGFWIAYLKDGSLKSYIGNIKKRIRSLLIPYMVVSGIYIIPLYFKQGGMTPGEILDTWLINPVPLQFWFLQKLMVLVLLSYILIKVVDKIPIATLSVMLIWYVLNQKNWGDWSEACFFYALGIFLAQRQIKRPHNLAILCCMIIYIISLLLETFSCDLYLLGGLWFYKIEIISGTLLIISWLFFSKSKISKEWISSGLGFFIFLFHEPLQGHIKNYVLLHFRGGQVHVTLSYFIVPCIVVGMCVLIFKVLKYVPIVREIVIGKR